MEIESSPDEKRKELLNALMLFAVVAVSWLCWYATPIAEWCVGAFVVWFLLARFENAWAKAAASKVFAFACGLVPVVVILLVFANVPPKGAEAPVARIEERILALNKDFEDLEKILNPWVTVGILIGLILISRYHPRWKAVQRYSWLSERIEIVAGIVGAAASFTFFTDVAITTSAAHVETRLQAIYHESPKNRAKYLAQEIVAKSVTTATKAPSAKNSYRPVVEYLAELGDRSMVQELLDNFLKYHDSNGAPHAAAAESQPAGDGAKKQAAEEPLPPTDQLLEAAKARKKAELDAKDGMEDAKKEMEAALDQGMGVGNDAIKDVVKKAVGKLLERWGGELVANWSETVSDYLADVTKESLEKAAEKWRDGIMERFEKLFPEAVKGKADVAAQFEKSEMAKLEDLTRQAEEQLNEKSTDNSGETPEDQLKRIGEQKAALESSAEGLIAAKKRLTLLLDHGGSATMPATAGGEKGTVANLMDRADQLVAAAGISRQTLEWNEQTIRVEHPNVDHPNVEKVGERKVPEAMPHP